MSDSSSIQNSRELTDLLSDKQVKQVGELLASFEVSFIDCRFWDLQPEWHIKLRSMPNSYFFFPVTGSFSAWVGTECVTVGPGEVLMIPDDVEHSISPDGKRELYQAISFHCNVFNLWKRPLLSMLQSPSAKLPSWDFWERQLRLLACTSNRDLLLGQMHGEILVKQLLCSLLMDGVFLDLPSEDVDERIANIIYYIHNHYMDDLTVTDLASTCRLGNSQFRKLFRKSVGVSPCAYVTKHRLTMAATLLKTTPMQVNEIAFKVGFNGEHYFHNQFKRAFSCTPSEYRRRSANWV